MAKTALDRFQQRHNIWEETEQVCCLKRHFSSIKNHQFRPKFSTRFEFSSKFSPAIEIAHQRSYTTSSRVSTEMGDRPFANLLLLLLLTGGYLIGQCTDLQKMHSMRRKSVMQEFYTQIIVMYMAEWAPPQGPSKTIVLLVLKHHRPHKVCDYAILAIFCTNLIQNCEFCLFLSKMLNFETWTWQLSTQSKHNVRD